MGYLIALMLGGCFGLLIMGVLSANKDDHEREKLIKRLKKEIREEMIQSGELNENEE